MKKFLTLILAVITVFAVLLLASCSSGQDLSAEIEKDVAAEFSVNNIDAGFHSPVIFENCELSENGGIEVTSTVDDVRITLQGDIKSHSTKINYADLEIRILVPFNGDSESSAYSPEDYAELWTSKMGVEFTKYTIDGNDYYIATDLSDTVFNMLCSNDGNLVLILGKLTDSTKISQTVEKKICKDFSIS